MTALASTHPTLVDVTKRLDAKGKIDSIAEILTAMNPMLDDAVVIEGNQTLGHRTTVRTGIPTPTWRKIYGGVQPTKSTTAQITESIGQLEAYAEIDATLAEINGNTAEWQLSEHLPFLEGFSQELSRKVIFGNDSLEPETFNGLEIRYNTRNTATAASAEHVLHGGAGDNTGSLASIWLVGWSPNGAHLIYPKGSKAGLSTTNKGLVTVENVDGANGRAEMYRTHYKWMCGLALRDWRYAVRICNIRRGDLTKNASAGADLIDLLTQAVELPPPGNTGRWAIYCDKGVRSFLRRQIANKVVNSTLTMETVGGKPVMMFSGIPVKRCDALAVDEAFVAA